MRGGDLRGADLRGADLRGADLRGGDLRGDLRGGDLRGADLRGDDLRDDGGDMTMRLGLRATGVWGSIRGFRAGIVVNIRYARYFFFFC
ncbi:MAG: hypothetical protein CL862_11105 [Cyanobium sp. NAT70]|nr:hypothetical protein [Cyanobium sp. NAT70]